MEALLLEEEQVEKLTSRLRAGDFSVTDDLIKCHIPLALELAKRFNNPDRQSVALLTLVVSVNKAQTALYDDNIGAYLRRCIYHALQRWCIEDKTIRVPSSSIKNRNLKFPHRSIALCDKSRELRELIYNCCETETERRIIQYREYGYSYREISKLVGKSINWVGIIVRRIEERFDEISKSN